MNKPEVLELGPEGQFDWSVLRRNFFLAVIFRVLDDRICARACFGILKPVLDACVGHGVRVEKRREHDLIILF